MSDLTKLQKDTPIERLLNGLLRENPTFVLMLGMCPTLAVTTSAMNGLGMGLATTAVLMMSNLIISLLRKVIPSRVRIPAFIVIIATFVTVVQLLLEAYLPSLNEALGMYISLIVVNCIILGRAESYAYSNPPLPSFFDGLGMGLGFSFALTCIGAVRELLGAGSLFDHAVMPKSYTPINIFILAPGAFFVLAALTAFQNFLKIRAAKAGKENRKIQSGCSEDCMNCSDQGCTRRFYDTAEKEKIVKEEKKIEKEEKKTVTESVTQKEKKASAKEKIVKEEKKTEKEEKKTVTESAAKKEKKASEKKEQKSEKDEKTKKAPSAEKTGKEEA